MNLSASEAAANSPDLKMLIQPMLEVMALSQVATFPNSSVPVVNFLRNKFVYRPLLYFKEVDVLLVTPTVMHLHTSENTIDILGLLAMFTNSQQIGSGCEWHYFAMQH